MLQAMQVHTMWHVPDMVRANERHDQFGHAPNHCTCKRNVRKSCSPLAPSHLLDLFCRQDLRGEGLDYLAPSLPRLQQVPRRVMSHQPKQDRDKCLKWDGILT